MRKASVTAQLSRTARRFSTAVAPQLTKLDFLPTLQATDQVTIQLKDVTQTHIAMENYILHNATNFTPIEFEVISNTNPPVCYLQIQLTAEEILISEGPKRVMSIVFAEVEGSVLARMRHPVSGMKMFEFADLTHTGNYNVMSSLDDSTRFTVNPYSNILRQLFGSCGCAFTDSWWSVFKEGVVIGNIDPKTWFWRENTVAISWKEDVDNENRQLLIGFAVAMLIKNGYPRIYQIIKSHRSKRTTN